MATAERNYSDATQVAKVVQRLKSPSESQEGVWNSGVIVPRIHNLDTRQIWEVSFKTQTLTTLNTGLFGSQIPFDSVHLLWNCNGGKSQTSTSSRAHFYETTVLPLRDITCHPSDSKICIDVIAALIPICLKYYCLFKMYYPYISK
jgi:hypothetical protein